MRTLGRGLAGGVTTGVSRVGGMAMSGLGAGLGIGAAFLGIQGLSGVFNKMLQVSPQLNAAMTQLSVSIGNALLPAATALANVLTNNLPAIESALQSFGTMLSDAIQFWTEDAFDPAVWADIGTAIAEAVKEAFSPQNIKQTVADVGATVEENTGSSVLRWIFENSMPMQVLNTISYFVGDEEGAKSL
jgi:hypothetical protein